MPVCAKCGKTFSGFSFGPISAPECKDCRMADAAAAKAAARVVSELGMTVGATTMPGATRAAMPFTPAVTLTLISLNVLVYLAMGVRGVSWMNPSVGDAARWGANFGPLTLSGQWWRLATCIFVHFGIIHIAFNIWCLFDLGRALEFFMGRTRFVLTYMLSGLAASLTSLAWNPWRVSAGASGAIFGVAGAFVSYLYLEKTPMNPVMVKQRLKSMAIFIGFNLLYGAQGGIDNSAHLGGLVSGLILGALVPPILMARIAANSLAGAAGAEPIESRASRESATNRTVWAIAAGGAAVLVIGAVLSYRMRVPVAQYGRAVQSVEAGRLDDGIAEMQRALTLDPSLLLGQEWLGELRLRQGDANEAYPVLEHALALAPEAYDIHHNLALAYLGSGEPHDAILAMNGVLAYEKQNDTDNAWRGQYILALAEEATGDTRQAAADLQAVVKAKPDFQEAGEELARLTPPSDSGAAATIPYAKVMVESEAWPLYP